MVRPANHGGAELLVEPAGAGSSAGLLRSIAWRISDAAWSMSAQLKRISDFVQGHAGLSQSCTWLMGVRYGHAIPRADSDATSPQAAAASSSLDSGSADQREALLGTRQVLTPEAQDDLLRDFSSRVWCTYRRDFPPLGPELLLGDVGWGCTIRSGQMMMAEALSRHRLGRAWRRRDHPPIQYQEPHLLFQSSGSDAALLELLSLFLDTPHASLSIHRICDAGRPHGVVPGKWLGPWVLCRGLAALVNSLPDLQVRVHVVCDPGGGAPAVDASHLMSLMVEEEPPPPPAPAHHQHHHQHHKTPDRPHSNGAPAAAAHLPGQQQAAEQRPEHLAAQLVEEQQQQQQQQVANGTTEAGLAVACGRPPLAPAPQHRPAAVRASPPAPQPHASDGAPPPPPPLGAPSHGEQPEEGQQQQQRRRRQFGAESAAPAGGAGPEESAEGVHGASGRTSTSTTASSSPAPSEAAAVAAVPPLAPNSPAAATGSGQADPLTAEAGAAPSPQSPARAAALDASERQLTPSDDVVALASAGSGGEGGGSSPVAEEPCVWVSPGVEEAAVELAGGADEDGGEPGSAGGAGDVLVVTAPAMHDPPLPPPPQLSSLSRGVSEAGRPASPVPSFTLVPPLPPPQPPVLQQEQAVESLHSPALAPAAASLASPAQPAQQLERRAGEEEEQEEEGDTGQLAVGAPSARQADAANAQEAGDGGGAPFASAAAAAPQPEDGPQGNGAAHHRSSSGGSEERHHTAAGSPTSPAGAGWRGGGGGGGTTASTTPAFLSPSTTPLLGNSLMAHEQGEAGGDHHHHNGGSGGRQRLHFAAAVPSSGAAAEQEEEQGGGAAAARPAPPGLVLLLPLTLGVGKANPLYYPQLLEVLTFPQSVGIVGGRPSASLYFVGHQDANLLYLDPHLPQQAAPLPGALHTYFCDAVRLMPITSMDPSLAIGFYCRGAGELKDLIGRLDRLARQHRQAPLVTLSGQGQRPPSSASSSHHHHHHSHHHHANGSSHHGGSGGEGFLEVPSRRSSRQLGGSGEWQLAGCASFELRGGGGGGGAGGQGQGGPDGEDLESWEMV